ncbi:jg23689, partial [Pararge aegeria aegeria]
YELDFPRTETTAPEKTVEADTEATEATQRESPASSSDESEPLSPPASPTQLHLDTTR